MTSSLIAFLLLASVSLLKLNSVKGWVGEIITSARIWGLLDKDIYRKIDDVVVPSASGTTQTDHVIVSGYGIFVIETINIKGWIFGSSEGDKWTQSIYGKKYQLQNSLKQNYRHLRCLEKHLGLDSALFKPVVFFIGDCKFKTPMPSNVMNGGLVSYIKSFRNICLTPKQVSETELRLMDLKRDKSLTKEAHLDSLTRCANGRNLPRCVLVAKIVLSGALLEKGTMLEILFLDVMDIRNASSPDQYESSNTMGGYST